MHKILYLAKILRKSGGGSEGGGQTGKRVIFLVIGVLIIIGFAVLGIMSGQLSDVLGDYRTFIKLIFFAGAVAALVFAIPGFINNMYMADDLLVLLTLPYTAWQITMAKVFNVSGIIWGISLIVTLPYGISYGIVAHMEWYYYLAIILAFICIPLIVTSVIGIVVIVIMYFVRSLRNKDTLRIIGTAVLFVIIALVLILVNSGNTNREQFASILSVAGRYSGILPINFALGVLLEKFTLVSLLEVIGITAAFVAVFLILAATLYLPGALSIQETSSVGRYLDDAALSKLCRRKSQVKAYTGKEIRHVRREPAYFMQGFLYTILYPAIIIIIYVVISGTTSFMKLSALVDDASKVAWCTGLTLMITFLAASTNAIACSSMSREGEGIMLLKQTPVNYKIILKSKLHAALYVCALGSTTYVVIGGIILAALGYLEFWMVAYALVLNIGILYFSICINMMHDIKKPSFTWESEAQMVKSCTGAGSIMMLFIGIFVPMLLVVLLGRAGSYFWAVVAGMIIICVVLGLFETKHMYKAGLTYMAKY